MTDKEKIREVIEKRYEYWKKKEFNSHSIESETRMSECQHLLLIVDSLPKETTDEVNCITQNDDLEEEYNNYFKKHEMDIVLNPYTNCKDIARHFAEWQKQQMNESLQTEYEKGLFDMREEMMKDACDTKITTDKGSSFPIIKYQLPLTYKCKIGDKVKLIIIKDDE